MLRAAIGSSFRRTSHHRSATAVLQSDNNRLLVQRRNYIFLPSSFSELQQMIQEAWSSQKERQHTVWVKLWQRPQEQLARTSSRNKRFRRSLSSKTKSFKLKHHNRYLASKRKFLKAKQTWRERAMTSYNNYFYYKSTLKEPAQADWFDADGYPKAVKNPFGRFLNPWNSQSTNGMQSLWLFFQWRMERLYNSVTRLSSPTALPPSTTPVQSLLAFQTTSPPADEIRCTWLGHSTTLVEMHGFTILTDPIFSQRASPIQSWPMGVARNTEAPCSIDDLPPKIHVCVISHDHYDHLDQSSVEQLKDRVTYWAVPLGMSEWLQDSCDVSPDSILEMTWWESRKLKRSTDSSDLVVMASDEETTTSNNTLELTCAPAQHWCGRNMWDRNQRLWCSWVVGSGGLKYFFAGDTALPESFPLHRQIGDRLGPFDVAALPIGAYAPSYFMNVSHVHPTEAVKIHQDLQVEKSMAIHWGTFNLSEEAHDEPPRLLKEAADKAGIDFVAVAQGECIVGPASSSEETLPMHDDEQEEETHRQHYG